MASAISGLPSKASTALNSTFCDCQPIELNASAKLKPSSAVDSALFRVASSSALLRASTSRSPRVVVTLLSLIQAWAELRTTLVTIWPLTASTLPEPQALPPEAVTLVSAVERMVARSSADTARLPATTLAWAMEAWTSERTSFITTSPPTARASESCRFPGLG